MKSVEADEGSAVAQLEREFDPKRVKGGYKIDVKTYQNADEVQDGYSRELVEQLVKGGSGCFNSQIVPYEVEKDPHYLVTKKSGLGDAAISWGLCLDGVTLPSKNMMFSPLIGEMFGEVIMKMKVDCVHGLDHCLRLQMIRFKVARNLPLLQVT